MYLALLESIINILILRRVYVGERELNERKRETSVETEEGRSCDTNIIHNCNPRRHIIIIKNDNTI